MNISPNWLREFIDLEVDNFRLAQDLTHVGIAVESMVGEGDATIFEMDITTNRVDAMNHYGIARECSAVYDINLVPIKPKLPAFIREAAFPIEILDPDLCARYTARSVCDLRIRKSPPHIAERLLIEDHHGINNVADATNYVLMELGHPTHAFDLDLLEGGKIVVRRARKGEKLKTLDGIVRELEPEDLIIADAVKPVGLAGVMGGFDTMITAKTRNVLIESAWFEPAAVRRTSRRLGMHTDASHRFERGADWGATPLACDRVAELVLETAGGKLGAHQDAVARSLEREPVHLDRAEVRRILGQEIPETDIVRILRRLGFEPTAQRATAAGISAATPIAVVEVPDSYSVAVPTWRMDVEREIDVIEEIARVYGFNNFANTLPAFAGGVVELPHARAESSLRTRLLALGYDEAVSTTFISSADAERFAHEPAVALENPMSEEAPVLRTTLVPGMLDMLSWNFNRDIRDLRLFEMGHIFTAIRNRVGERGSVCFAATGAAAANSLESQSRALDFFDLKGDSEDLLAIFAAESVRFDAPAADYYHPGRSARIVLDKTVVGHLGQLHPEIASARKFKQDVWLAEFNLERLFAIPLREPRYERLSRYPQVDRDFSLLLDNKVTYDTLRRSLEALHIPELRQIEPRELFRGGNVPEGKYSMLLHLTFQSTERTLRDEEVAAWSHQVIAAMEALGGTLRA